MTCLGRPGATPTARIDGAPTAAEVRVNGDRLSLTVADVAPGSRLRVSLDPSPRVPENDVPGRLFALLDRAHIEFEVKTRIHRIATADRPLSVRVSHLQALALPPSLLTAVSEILLA